MDLDWPGRSNAAGICATARAASRIVTAEPVQEHGLGQVVMRSSGLVRRVNERFAGDYMLVDVPWLRWRSIPPGVPLVAMPHDRDEVVTAIRHCYARHGRPPSQEEWDRSAPEGLPSTRTIRRRFGWRRMLLEALGDEEPRAGRPGSSWSRSEMIKALLKARAEAGAWPSGYAWEAATAEHPARGTYVRLFGSWPGAIAAAEAEAVGDRSHGESSSRT